MQLNIFVCNFPVRRFMLFTDMLTGVSFVLGNHFTIFFFASVAYGYSLAQNIFMLAFSCTNQK